MRARKTGLAKKNVSCNGMITPAQLSAHLDQLDINRTERVLTDWRHKGLLPPLWHRGLGRGKGSEYLWDESVLDQAIAAHLLLRSYARADEALLGLWLSGYTVSPVSAQGAWIRHLELVRERRQKAASNLKGGYLGLGDLWWRNLPKHLRDRSSIRNFIFETPEWLYENSECDDEGYRLAIAELISGLKERTPVKEVIPTEELYDFVGTIWDELDLSTIFRVNQSIEFVRSMSESELNAAHQSLAAIRHMIQHWIELTGGTVDHVTIVLIQVKLMQHLIGPFVAMSLLLLNRTHPDLPLAGTISTIHGFVMGVKLEDISQDSDGTFRFSQRVNSEWMTVKEDLARHWSAVPENEVK